MKVTVNNIKACAGKKKGCEINKDLPYLKAA